MIFSYFGSETVKFEAYVFLDIDPSIIQKKRDPQHHDVNGQKTFNC